MLRIFLIYYFLMEKRSQESKFSKNDGSPKDHVKYIVRFN